MKDGLNAEMLHTATTTVSKQAEREVTNLELAMGTPNALPPEAQLSNGKGGKDDID